ncbi:MAG TPA: TonB-dependent receptor plug domain-containing protein, partial [Longimicrobiaceae bacterium]
MIVRLLVLIGAGCALGASPAAAQPFSPALLPDTTQAPAVRDTTAALRFDIPALPLADALRRFARTAGVQVEVDARAAVGARSHPVSGVYTAPEALRQLLAGTRLSARFTEGGRALVLRGEADASVTWALTPLAVLGERSRSYATTRTTSATKTDTPLRDAPQAVSVVTRDVIADQAMQGMADVVRLVPGVTMGQGEGHRDAPTIRGNSSTADFFVDGVRDDAQYFRDLYNVERVEALKGSNALIFGRGGGGGVLNRVTKEAQWTPVRAFSAEGGSYGHMRASIDVGQGVGPNVAARLNGVYENSEGFRDRSSLERHGVNPTVALAFGATTVRAGYEYFSDDRNVDRGIPSFQGRPSDASVTTFFGNPDLSY